MRVPPPGGAEIANVPPTAATRSRRPRSPDPLTVRPADAVVGDLEAQAAIVARARPGPSWRRRAWRRWRGPPRRRSRRRSRRPTGGGRPARGRPRPGTGSGPRATARPHRGRASRRIAGSRPCASSRSSAIAARTSSRRRPAPPATLSGTTAPSRDRIVRSDDGEGEQALLGAVVEVPFHAAPLGVGGLHDPGAGTRGPRRAAREGRPGAGRCRPRGRPPRPRSGPGPGRRAGSRRGRRRTACGRRPRWP